MTLKEKLDRFGKKKKRWVSPPERAKGEYLSEIEYPKDRNPVWKMGRAMRGLTDED